MTHTEFGQRATAKLFSSVAQEEINRMSNAPVRLLSGYYAITSKYNQQQKEMQNAQRISQ
jgi:hypothetical protein